MTAQVVTMGTKNVRFVEETQQDARVLQQQPVEEQIELPDVETGRGTREGGDDPWIVDSGRYEDPGEP